MTLPLHIQLVHIIVEQMPSNTTLPLIKCDNGIN